VIGQATTRSREGHWRAPEIAQTVAAEKAMVTIEDGRVDRARPSDVTRGAAMQSFAIAANPLAGAGEREDRVST
jgi:hypothetical protein